MTAGTLAPGGPIARHRWLVWVLVVFGAQVGIILWLGARRPPAVRPVVDGVSLSVARGTHLDLVAYQDPTLFALPHRRGFSGAAWLHAPPLRLPTFEWPDEPRWLALSTIRLGQAFQDHMASNSFVSLPAPDQSRPDLTLPPPVAFQLLPERSTVRVEGALADRLPSRAFNVSPWPHTDLLAPSVVQVVVDPQGWPVSVGLLSSSGLKAADDQALREARSARFQNRPPRAAENGSRHQELAWGKLVFQWQTLPPNP